MRPVWRLWSSMPTPVDRQPDAHRPRPTARPRGRAAVRPPVPDPGVGTAAGGYAAASPVVSFGGLAFDVVVEIVLAYIPFFALAVMVGALTDPRPLTRGAL